MWHGVWKRARDQTTVTVRRPRVLANVIFNKCFVLLLFFKFLQDPDASLWENIVVVSTTSPSWRSRLQHQEVSFNIDPELFKS